MATRLEFPTPHLAEHHNLPRLLRILPLCIIHQLHCIVNPNGAYVQSSCRSACTSDSIAGFIG